MALLSFLGETTNYELSQDLKCWRSQQPALSLGFKKVPTLNDGQSRVEGRPDCVLVVLREDDDQGLLTAITERPPSKQRTKEIIAGCQLQPASGGRQFDSRSSVYFNIVKCLQLHDGELRFKSGMKAKL